MTLSEIENLSFAELKARREELIQAAQELPAADIAARYTRARTDAKLRDEKLSEQGKTIDALTAGHDALQGQLAFKEQQVRDLAERHNALQEQFFAAEKALQEQKEATAAERMRANNAEALAKARRTALADVMKVISPVLAEE